MCAIHSVRGRGGNKRFALIRRGRNSVVKGLSGGRHRRWRQSGGACDGVGSPCGTNRARDCRDEARRSRIAAGDAGTREATGRGTR